MMIWVRQQQCYYFPYLHVVYIDSTYIIHVLHVYGPRSSKVRSHMSGIVGWVTGAIWTASQNI